MDGVALAELASFEAAMQADALLEKGDIEGSRDVAENHQGD